MDAIIRGIERLVDIALGVDPVEMLIQIGATALLIIVVKFFFWDKVTAFLDKRREAVDKEMTEAAEQNEEAKSLKKDAEYELKEARKEAQSLIDEAKTKSEDMKRDIIAEAKKDAQHIRKNAERDLEKEIRIARTKLRNEIIGVATALSKRVLHDEIDEETYERYLDEAIEEVRKQ